MRRKKRLLIGLTGSIGSGKSETLRAFSRAGAGAFSADAVAHELSGRGGSVCRAVVRTFGTGVLAPDGGLDRKVLAEAVFSSPAKRRRLEAAAHPVIRRELRRRVERCPKPVVVVDVPLLFENGRQEDFDITLTVSAPREERLRRVMRRDGLRRADALRRETAQMPQAEKERLADIVVANTGTRRGLEKTVRGYQKAFDLIARSPQRRKP